MIGLANGLIFERASVSMERVDYQLSYLINFLKFLRKTNIYQFVMLLDVPPSFDHISSIILKYLTNSVWSSSIIYIIG